MPADPKDGRSETAVFETAGGVAYVESWVRLGHDASNEMARALVAELDRARELNRQLSEQVEAVRVIYDEMGGTNDGTLLIRKALRRRLAAALGLET